MHTRVNGKAPGFVAIGTQSLNPRRLRPYNTAAGCLHLASAVAIGALSNALSMTVYAAPLTGPPASGAVPVPRPLFEVSFRAVLATFFALSSFAHFIVAGPCWVSYTGYLEERQNPYRWAEYSVSSSLMIVLIALLTGISDIAALIGLFGANASMIGFGWLQERYAPPGSHQWGPFLAGCGAGAAPWVAIFVYLCTPGAAARVPGFVWAIYGSLFTCFNIFALNQFAQFSERGRWRDYIFGEYAYITMSIVAKSLLAWQIYASALASSLVN